MRIPNNDGDGIRNRSNPKKDADKMRILIISLIALTRFFLLEFLFFSFADMFLPAANFRQTISIVARLPPKAVEGFWDTMVRATVVFTTGQQHITKHTFIRAASTSGASSGSHLTHRFAVHQAERNEIDNPRDSTVATGSRAVFKTLFSIVSRSVCFNGRHQALGT